MNNESKSGGVGILGVFGIVLIVLKLFKLINLSWIWVLLPFWMPVVVGILLGIVLLIMDWLDNDETYL